MLFDPRYRFKNVYLYFQNRRKEKEWRESQVSMKKVFEACQQLFNGDCIPMRKQTLRNFIYTLRCTYIYERICIYIMFLIKCMYLCICNYIHMYVCIYIYVCMYACKHMLSHHTHTYIHTYIFAISACINRCVCNIYILTNKGYR